MKEIVLVLGMHRSGTSYVSEICNHLGVYFGKEDELFGGEKWNPDGYFENKSIVDYHDSILSGYNRKWYSLLSADSNKEMADNNVKEQIKNVIYGLLKNHSVIGIKDPRMCLFLPMWREIIEFMQIKVKIIVVYRNPSDVVASLMRRDKLPEEYLYNLWLRYNTELLKNIGFADEILILNYSNVLGDELKYKFIMKQFIYDKAVILRSEEKNILSKKQYCHFQTSRNNFSKYSNINKVWNILQQNTDITIKKWIYTDYMSGILNELQQNLRIIQNNGLVNIDANEMIYNNSNKADIIIYGAGDYGMKAFNRIKQNNKFNFICFCDLLKYGDTYIGERIISVKELVDDVLTKSDVNVVIALKNIEVIKEVILLLNYTSVFTLNSLQ